MSEPPALRRLSLQFTDATMEEEYSVRQFKQSHAVVIVVCAVNACSHVLMALVIPEVVAARPTPSLLAVPVMHMFMYVYMYGKFW